MAKKPTLEEEAARRTVLKWIAEDRDGSVHSPLFPFIYMSIGILLEGAPLLVAWIVGRAILPGYFIVLQIAMGMIALTLFLGTVVLWYTLTSSGIDVVRRSARLIRTLKQMETAIDEEADSYDI